MAAILAAAAFLTWWRSEPIAVRSSATLVLAVGVGLTLYTALQCVPLPLSVLRAIAPHNAEVWSRALAPFGEAGPSWAPLSLDPVATRVEVLKGTAYVLAFVTALRISRRRRGAVGLNFLLIASGLILAVAALLHPAVGAHRVFGVYEPSQPVSPRHLAPLLNPNNLSGYLNVSICVALAAIVAPEPMMPRVLGAAIVVFLGATQLWIASRGGVIGMGLGLLLVPLAARATHSDRRDVRVGQTVIAAMGIAVGVVLTILASSDEAAGELLSSGASKLELIAVTFRMLPAVPLLGCGRGAFESAFSAFRTGYSGHVTMAFPENVVAQWVLEWGVPVGLGAMILLVFALRPGVALARSTRAAGAWVALVALSVQELCDLGSEVPGLVLAGVVCCALVVGGSPGQRRPWRVEHWPRPPLRVAVTAAVLACAAIAWGATSVGHDVGEDRRALYDETVARDVPLARAKSLVRAAILRHPAEPYLPYAVALRAYGARENPMPWIAGTLERAPVYAPAHLLLARLVAGRSASQSRLEYRLAIEQMPDLASIVLAEAPRLVSDYYDALELMPRGAVGLTVLESLAQTLRYRLPATSVRLDEEIARRAPSNPGPVLRAAEGRLADLSKPWCEGPSRSLCLTAALRAAAEARDREAQSCAPRVLHARARAAGGDVLGGLEELQASASQVSDREGCLRELVAFASEVGDTEHVSQALDAISNLGCASDRDCASRFEWVAQQEDARGAPRKALALYRRALDRVPDDEGVLEAIGRLAARLGMHAEAADSFAHLARLHPMDPRWREAETAERYAALKGRFGVAE
ncbi:MAG: O-antigen ligase family protein [Polyangiaceae bacterium]|nr:O-antigen ligase family protein [Polyangiaceae bacterium]